MNSESQDPIDRQLQERLKFNNWAVGLKDPAHLVVRADELARECAALRQLCRVLLDGFWFELRDPTVIDDTTIPKMKAAADGKEVK